MDSKEIEKLVLVERFLSYDKSEDLPEFTTLNSYKKYIAETIQKEISILIRQNKITEAINLFNTLSTKWKNETLTLANYKSREILFFEKTLIEECENEVLNIFNGTLR